MQNIAASHHEFTCRPRSSNFSQICGLGCYLLLLDRHGDELQPLQTDGFRCWIWGQLWFGVPFLLAHCVCMESPRFMCNIIHHIYIYMYYICQNDFRSKRWYPGIKNNIAAVGRSYLGFDRFPYHSWFTQCLCKRCKHISTRSDI